MKPKGQKMSRALKTTKPVKAMKAVKPVKMKAVKPKQSAKIAQKANRTAPRKETAIWISDVQSLNDHSVLFSQAIVKDVSSSGLLIHVAREHIVNRSLRATLTFDHLRELGVSFRLEGMTTVLEGIVIRTKPLGRGSFELGIDFREDAPQYWREILVELMPDGSGEF